VGHPDNLVDSQAVTVTQTAPGYLTASIHNGAHNLFTPTVFAGLRLLQQYAEDPDHGVKLFVLESANPDFFIAHLDFASLATVPDIPGAANVIEHWPAFSHWLSTTPIVSISKVRGRARGIGNELILATDLRFGSRERALFAQIEVGFGFVPGGGGVEWLPARIGRARALEAILSADDFDADTAELYGWINRAVPDDELDRTVDALARRISSFDAVALATAKRQVTLRNPVPSIEDLRQSFDTILALAASDAGRAETARLVAKAGGSLAASELDLTNLYGAAGD
jgi:enoyl-CoA hydratase/carnithine racemase